jgi:hypothetical protein
MLLANPVIAPSHDSFVGKFGNSSITMDEVVDTHSENDNYYTTLYTSVMSVYFWIFGRWDQLDHWESFWAVNVIAFIASFVMVVVMQNVLIALMTYVLRLFVYVCIYVSLY